MRIIEIINEGTSNPWREKIKDEYGGGQIKIDHFFNKDNILLKYSFAYINHLWCKADPTGRIYAVDSAHVGHPKYCPHLHQCGRHTDLDENLTIIVAAELFFDGMIK